MNGASARPGVESPALGQHVVGTDCVGVVVGHPSGAVGTAGLLVGHSEVDEVAGGSETAVCEVAERDRHRCGEVEHVDGAASPHLGPVGTVDDLAPERVLAPTGCVDRDDICVSHEAQARSGGVRSCDPSDDRHPTGRRFVALDLHAGTLDHLLEHVGVAHLLARGFGAVVHAAVADEDLEQFDGGVGQSVELPIIEVWGRRHRPSFPYPPSSRLREQFGWGGPTKVSRKRGGEWGYANGVGAERTAAMRLALTEGWPGRLTMRGWAKVTTRSSSSCHRTSTSSADKRPGPAVSTSPA